MGNNDDWEFLTVAMGMVDDLSRWVVQKRTKDQTLRNGWRMKILENYTEKEEPAKDLVWKS